MPLLKKQPFEKVKPPPDLKPDDLVFYSEVTKEIFLDYEDFFQRTILCNSLVWSCSITGKSNLTFEEALESESKAKKRLGNLPKPLKKGLLWLASRTKRGRVIELCDDVYAYANVRFFKDEIVEAIINDQWCDARVVKVIPPTEEELAEDAKQSEAEVEVIDGSPKKEKDKKKFFPPDYMFKYEVEEADPEDEDMVQMYVIVAEDVRREKGILSREKLNLFMKNVVELDGANFRVKPAAMKKYGVDSVKFDDFFAGPEPQFEEKLRKYVGQSVAHVKKIKKPGQGTLDGWMTGQRVQDPSQRMTQPSQPIRPKQTPEEIEAEMKKMREQQAKFKEEMRQRAEEAKKRRIEEKAREKERKKEEKRLINELMSEWSRKRDDLECEDLKELPKPTPVHCKIPNQLFGDFVMLLEFLQSFYDILEVKDSYPNGVSIDELEKALTETDTPGGSLYEILNFMLVTLFDLQLEEEEEARAESDKSQLDELDKNVLGRNEDIADAIKTATEAASYTKRNLGLALREVHIDEMSVTEVLRLHLESSGAYRGNNLQNWRYQQRGGFRLNDDPGLQFRMDEPQILAALQEKTVYELSLDDKMKVLVCLMNQMLTFAGVRDEIDTRAENLIEGKADLREATIQENRRIKEDEAKEKQRIKEERMKMIEERLKAQEQFRKEKEDKEKAEKEENKENKEEKKEEKEKKDEKVEPVVLLTDRQREALQTQKEKEERDKQRLEEVKRSEFYEKEKRLQEAISEYQNKVSVQCLGRDRAYRRFWSFESIPGVFVEHDDDTAGDCLDKPTPFDPSAGPIDEDTATKRAREIMQVKTGVISKEKQEKTGIDKNMEVHKVADVNKTYSKKNPVLNPAPTQNGGEVKLTNGDVSHAEKKELSNKEEDPEIVVVNETSDDKSEVKAVTVEEKCETGINALEETPDTNTLEEKSKAPWGRCESDKDNCPVHSAILPRTHWAFYSTEEEIDDLISSLNERGFRESELKENLILEREKLERRLKKCPKYLLNKTEEQLKDELEMAREEVMKLREEEREEDGKMALPIGTPMSDLVEIALRDQMLELEEKIYFGSLGALRVRERAIWQNALQNRGYEMCCDNLSWGGEDNNTLTLDSVAASREPSRPNTPDSGNKRDSTGSNKSDGEKGKTVVRQLACAILQVGQMVDKKYFKAPLGEDEKDLKKRLKEEEKRKKEREADEEEGIVCETSEKEVQTPFQKWETSLMSSTNFAQLFIHLTSLDNSITWSKSIMNTKCRMCRRKTDPENMLLCDGCDRGHHLYCLKPKLKSIPKGDWFCSDCKPKERIRSPKKKLRRVFSSTESDEESEEDEEEDKEETEEEDDDDSTEEEEELPPPPPKKKKNSSKAKKKLDVGTKGGSKKKGLASLLGKRKAATDASEKIKSGQEDVREMRETRRPKRNEKEKDDGARGKRRRDVDEDIELQFNVAGLEDLVNGMMRNKDGWPFDRPITKVDAPDYHLMISRPMDLGTIRSKINHIQYSCNQEVLDDMRQVFKNCYQYNHEDAEEYQCALRLEKYFEKEIRKLGLTEDSPPRGKAKKSRRTT